MPARSQPAVSDAGLRARAWAAHVLTASSIGFDLLAVRELLAADPDPRRVFAWLLVPVLIDAVDGPLARRWNVNMWAAAVDGRTIDNIPLIVDAVVWAALLVAMLPSYPRPAPWLVWASLAYPAFYVVLSIALDARSREGGRRPLA